MNKRNLLILILGVTIIIILVLTIFNQQERYQKLIISEDNLNKLTSSKLVTSNLYLENIKFNDYSLLIDEDNSTIYYSVVDSSNKYNPLIEYKTNLDNIKIAFSENITDTLIANNYNFKVILYNDSNYRIYNLVVTTLPIMNITYDNTSDKTKNIPMELSLFDNNPKAFQKNTSTKGELTITENDTGKSDYRISLKMQSLGHNERENNLSILGMQKHSEYILNSLYDSEMIRRVFTTNLWNELDNHEDNYQYVELFINNEYQGLYSFGYDIEPVYLGLSPDEFLFYKKNLVNSEINYNSVERLEGYTLHNHLLDRIKRRDEKPINCPDDNCEKIDAWSELNNYYQTLFSNDITKIKNLTNLDNATDIYLYYLFVEPSDHLDNNTFANTYLVFRKTNSGYQVSYLPWNMNYTFGNALIDNKVSEYYNSSNNNTFIMNYNPINILLNLNDEDTLKLVKGRYQELRNNAWSNDNINKLLSEYEEDIYSSGAYLRNNLKWNQSNTNNKLTNFKKYVNNRLSSMDEYINNLS